MKFRAGRRKPYWKALRGVVLASVMVSLPAREKDFSPMVRVWLEGAEADPVSETTRIRPEIAFSGTVASTRVEVTRSGLTRMFLSGPRKATEATVSMSVPVTWTDPPVETSRILVQPVRQITFEIFGTSGSSSPPPEVAAPVAVAGPNATGTRQVRMAAKAVSENGFDRLGFNLFPGACGVSWRARAERVALRSCTCLRFAPGRRISRWFLRPSRWKEGFGYRFGEYRSS
jgi:hypothetical protein